MSISRLVSSVYSRESSKILLWLYEFSKNSRNLLNSKTYCVSEFRIAFCASCKISFRLLFIDLGISLSFFFLWTGTLKSGSFSCFL